MVGKGGHGRNSGGFLSTAETTSRDEHASELAVQFALLPEVTGRIPKRLQKKKGSDISPSSGTDPKRKRREGGPCAHLPLRGEVAVSGGNTEKEGIKVGQFCGGDDGVVGLGGGVHLGQDLLGKGLSDPGGEIDQMMGPAAAIVIILTGRW